METYDALRQADEVRTFPSITMPAPTPTAFKVQTGKTTYSRQKDMLSNVKKYKPLDGFPGLLKSKKSALTVGVKTDGSSNIFTGFNNVNLKLDVKDTIPAVYEKAREHNQVNGVPEVPHTGRNVMGGIVDLGINVLPSMRQTAPSQRKEKNPDPTMDELRNYIVLMDKYSMHNFLIYEGRTLKDTPEFQSFQRSYQYKWGAISQIIYQLEEFLTKNDVKLAIINGPQIFDLAKLNLPVLKKEELYSCIANIEQIEASLDSGVDVSKKQMIRLVVKIQSVGRMYIAKQRYKRLQFEIKCAIIIQAQARRMIQRVRFRQLVKNTHDNYEERKKVHRKKMKEWWKTRSIDVSLDKSRLIVFFPSISAQEYVRINMEDFAAMQNSNISNLSMLMDPNVHLMYVVPFHMTGYQMQYHEKFLSLMGISTLPKRLTFITPEASEKLPGQLSLSQQLWFSSVALKKIRHEVRKSKMSMIIASSLGWAEKRIAKFLDIPILGCDPIIAETFSSRSYLKTFLMETGVNIPIGSHDIYSVDDLILALTRLLSSNLGVIRWIIRLNCDYNNESVIYFDAERLPLIPQLRMEQTEMIGEKENTASWYSKPIQIAVRKRILVALKKEFLSKIKICRKDVFTNWEQYARLIKVYGCVIEAEPIEKIGHVVSTCFISPLGDVEVTPNGFQAHVDEHLQIHSYSYPQQATPPPALHGVSKALATRLFKENKVTGHVSFYFVSFWDALDNQPRLWGTDIRFGTSPLFGAIGTTSLVANDVVPSIPLSLLPALPEGDLFMPYQFI